MPDPVRRIVAFLVAIGVFSLDRWTKWIIETQFGAFDTKIVIPGFFNIVRSQNSGVAFGIFADNTSQSRTPVLIGLSVVAVLLLAGMLWRIDRLDSPSATGLALIFGGAMGNVFDRVRVGSVTDFLDFYAGQYHWYTFNVADASICTGAGLLILSMVLSQRHGLEKDRPGQDREARV
jgi:signal peptidase II